MSGLEGLQAAGTRTHRPRAPDQRSPAWETEVPGRPAERAQGGEGKRGGHSCPARWGNPSKRASCGARKPVSSRQSKRGAGGPRGQAPRKLAQRPAPVSGFLLIPPSPRNVFAGTTCFSRHASSRVFDEVRRTLLRAREARRTRGEEQGAARGQHGSGRRCALLLSGQGPQGPRPSKGTGTLQLPVGGDGGRGCHMGAGGAEHGVPWEGV